MDIKYQNITIYENKDNENNVLLEWTTNCKGQQGAWTTLPRLKKLSWGQVFIENCLLLGMELKGKGLSCLCPWYSQVKVYTCFPTRNQVRNYGPELSKIYFPLCRLQQWGGKDVDHGILLKHPCSGVSWSQIAALGWGQLGTFIT